MATSSNISPLKRFIKLLLPEKELVVIIYIYGIFAGLVSLTLPLGIQAIINLIVGGAVSSSWILLVVLVIAGVAISGVLQVRQLIVTELLQEKIYSKTSFEFAYRIPRFKLDHLRGNYLPELINRFFDTLTVQKGLGKVLIDFSTGAIQIIFGLLLLSFYHPFFIIFSVILLLMIFLVVAYTGPRGIQISLKESHHKYETAAWLEELARNVETFKMHPDIDFPLKQNDYFTTAYLKARQAHFRIIVGQFSLAIAFKTLISAGLLVIGAYLVFEQEMNIGQFVAAEIVIILLIGAVEKLISTIETIYDVLIGVEKLAAVTDIPLEGFLCGDKSIDPTKGIAIKLKDTSLKQEDHYFLQALNLDIQAGEKVAIAGPADAGKTMLLQLIAGWYDTYEGNILLNDLPLKDLDIALLRKEMGDCMATQSIFAGTLEDNIRIGDWKATFEEIREVVKETGLQAYLDTNQLGYRKMLVPGDKRLPKRAEQQILWSRGLLGNKKLLLWEDVHGRLSHLEKLRFVKKLVAKEEVTLLIVSNDLSIVKRCDRAIGMEEGKIIHDMTAQEAVKNQWFKEKCRFQDA